MPPPQFLLDSVNDLEQCCTRMMSLWKNRPENWKPDYARARLILEDNMTSTFGKFETWLGQQSDPEAMARYNEMVGEMRRKLAQHQARFPVLIIERDNLAYNGSMSDVDMSFESVIALMRQLLRR